MSSEIHLNKPKNVTAPFVRLLATTVWISTVLFGLYILAFYATSLIKGNPIQWNKTLPGLYGVNTNIATTGIGFHFAAGGIILILGCIQLIDKLREKFLNFHKWVGILYILASLIAAIGGLTFILVKGTIGGTIMDIGFSLYGFLMIIAAIFTLKNALSKNIVQHKVWAFRLFALAVGSWLYRMDYGFWFILADGVGHAKNFQGPFDQVMAFFFYIPNLIIVEIILRSKKETLPKYLNFGFSVIFILATVFIMIGTYFFTKQYWGPAILSWFS